jgi:hypothetical protein
MYCSYCNVVLRIFVTHLFNTLLIIFEDYILYTYEYMEGKKGKVVSVHN